MESTSELILRNRRALPAGPVLLFNPPRDDLFRQLGPPETVRVFTQDYGDFEWLRAAGAEAAFGLLPWRLAEIPGMPGSGPGEAPPPRPAGAAQTPGAPAASAPARDEPPATVILFLPREKERLDLLLHAVASRLPAEGELWLVGANRAGIRSAGKRLHARFGAVAKLDSARHCGLFRATGPQPGEAFRLAHYREHWELQLPAGLGGGPLRIASLPGVFAHGRLDGGTALLLQFLAQHHPRLGLRGTLLDFGCGAGVLGLALLRAEPDLRVTLLDSSAAALASAAWSLAANGVAYDRETGTPESAARMLAADGLPGAGPALDWIVSNPPFHRGVDTDLGIARRFFARAALRLGKTGRLLLVCNRHLPYERWLGEHFPLVENPAGNRDFKVLLAACGRR